MAARASLAGSPLTMLGMFSRHGRLLASITRVEIAKRHAGSLLGLTWVILQPALLLSVYLFVYMVIGGTRVTSTSSRFEFVLYVFCGLVPYLGFMEALTSGGVAIRQNIHLVKNVMLPIELIPVRSVLVGMISEFVSLAIVVVLVAAGGMLTPRIVLLPVVVLLQLMWLVGLTWILSSVTVALPDITYFVNLFVFLLMFVSPIGYRPDLVPASLRVTLYFNPIFYLTRIFRATLLTSEPASASLWAAYTVMCAGTFVIGSVFFNAFKDVLVDYE
jgi:lipopolysaccharide transport system permease protein